MGNLNRIANEKLQYKGDFLKWQDVMHPIFCNVLAKPPVFNTLPLPRPADPVNVTNSTNLRRQKLVDDWDKANELATAAILANLRSRYKHLVRDYSLSAWELWVLLKSKLCVVSASSKDTARSKWLACIQGSSQAVDVHLDNYLRAVDHLAAMQIEESEDSILARLLHSIDKSRSSTECIVVDSWGRQKRTLTISSFIKKMQSKSTDRKKLKAARWRLP